MRMRMRMSRGKGRSSNKKRWRKKNKDESNEMNRYTDRNEKKMRRGIEMRGIINLNKMKI